MNPVEKQNKGAPVRCWFVQVPTMPVIYIDAPDVITARFGALKPLGLAASHANDFATVKSGMAIRVQDASLQIARDALSQARAESVRGRR